MEGDGGARPAKRGRRDDNSIGLHGNEVQRIQCGMPRCQAKVVPTSLRNHLNSAHWNDKLTPELANSWVRCASCNKCCKKTAKGSPNRHNCSDSPPREESVSPPREEFLPTPTDSEGDEGESCGEDPHAISELDEVVSQEIMQKSSVTLANAGQCLRHLDRMAWKDFQEVNKQDWASEASKAGDADADRVGALIEAFAKVPAKALRRTFRGGKRGAKVVQKRCRAIIAGDSKGHATQARKTKARVSDEMGSRVRKAMATMRNGAGLAGNNKKRMSRAIQTLMDRQPKAPLDDDAKRVLKKLHPKQLAGVSVPLLPDYAPKLLEVDLAVLLKELKAMASGAHPGPDHWSAELLLALWGDEVCAVAVGVLVRHLANGNVNQRGRDLVLASLLTLLQKPNGGKRPIAMVGTLYKLTARYLLKIQAQEVKKALPSVQLVESAGGSEVAVHKLRASLEAGPHHILISNDLPNAFNLRSRARALVKLLSNPALQGLWRFTFMAYGAPADLLVLGEDEKVQWCLRSLEGVRQGDPLALFLFSLSLQDSFALAESVQGVSAAAIADDLEIVGPVDSAFEAFDRVVEHLDQEHVELTSDKRFALWIHNSPPPARLAELCARRGIHLVAGGEQPDGSWRGGCEVVLGCMFSANAEDIHSWVAGKVLAHEPFFEALCHRDMKVQAAVTLLRAGGVPKMNFLARVVPPEDLAQGARTFDELVLDALERILQLQFVRDNKGAVDVNDPVIVALRRGISKAGFGIRSVEVLSPIAFFAASVQAFPHTQSLLTDTFERATNLAQQPPAAHQIVTPLNPAAHYSSAIESSFLITLARLGSSDDPSYEERLKNARVPSTFTDFSAFYGTSTTQDERWAKGLQHDITEQVEKLAFDTYLELAEPMEKARLNSQRGTAATGWLTATGYHHDTQILCPQFIRIAHFFLALHQKDSCLKDCILCGKSNITFDHALSCKPATRSLRALPHDHIEAILAFFYKHELGLTTARQPKSDLDGKLTDIQIIRDNGSVAEIDIVTSLPTAGSYFRQAAAAPGHCAAVSHAAKEEKHGASVRKNGGSFQPFSIELYGHMHPTAHKECRAIAENFAAKYPELFELGQVTSHVLQRVSIAMQVGISHAFRRFAQFTQAKVNTPLNPRQPIQGSFSRAGTKRHPDDDEGSLSFPTLHAARTRASAQHSPPHVRSSRRTSPLASSPAPPVDVREGARNLQEALVKGGFSLRMASELDNAADDGVWLDMDAAQLCALIMPSLLDEATPGVPPTQSVREAVAKHALQLCGDEEYKPRRDALFCDYDAGGVLPKPWNVDDIQRWCEKVEMSVDTGPLFLLVAADCCLSDLVLVILGDEGLAVDTFPFLPSAPHPSHDEPVDQPVNSVIVGGLRGGSKGRFVELVELPAVRVVQVDEDLEPEHEVATDAEMFGDDITLGYADFEEDDTHLLRPLVLRPRPVMQPAPPPVACPHSIDLGAVCSGCSSPPVVTVKRVRWVDVSDGRSLEEFCIGDSP